MNWLAHVFLSESDIDSRLGNLLADHVKNDAWPGMRARFRAGVTMHRAVDAYTDAHPCFLASRKRLGAQGRLRGVVIDIVYDHMLTRHWDRFAEEALRSYLDRFYREAAAVVDAYPETSRTFIQSVIDHDRLGRYGDLASVEEGLGRIDRRLSPRLAARERASGYMQMVEGSYTDLEADFLTFFPELSTFVQSRLPDVLLQHRLTGEDLGAHLVP